MAMISRLLLSRFAVPAAGLLSLVAISIVYLRFPGLFWDVMKMMISWPASRPFADWEAVLVSIRCWSEGANVYFENACYPVGVGQPAGFSYSPLWLRLSFLRFGVPWIYQTMLAVVVLFLLSLATLPPPHRLREQAILLAATLSGSIMCGLQIGNVDLILFLWIVVAANLSVMAMPFRVLGYGLIIFAGLLKFYPFVALAIVLRERVSVLVAVASASVTALAALIIAYHQELGWINLPKPNYFNLQFGSANLPVVLGVTVANILEMAAHFDISAARAAGAMVARVALPCLVVMSLIGAVTIGHRCRLPVVVARLSVRRTIFLVAGAAVICGCFFAFNSHVYRGMYLLLALPGLAALSRLVAAPLGGRVFTTTCFAIPFVLWKPFFDMSIAAASHWKSPRGNNSDPYDAFPGFNPEYLVWLTTELAWWWIVTVLLAILGAFALNSDAWALVCRILRIPQPNATSVERSA